MIRDKSFISLHGMVLFSGIDIAIHAFKNTPLFHVFLFHGGLILMSVLRKLEFSFLP